MQRKLTIVALGVALAGIAVSARSAQDSVDDIIARNIKAKGGLERIASIQTLKQTSVVQTGGMEMALTVFAKRPNRVRQEVRFSDKLIVSGFDGQTPWIVNPLLGEPARPVVMAGPQADQIKADSNFDGPLVDYKAQGYTVTLADPELEGGKSLVHLRLTAPGGRVTHVYLDPATWLDVKHVSEVGPTRLEQQFGSYRTIDGFTAPFLIRQVVNGVTQSEIRVGKVEFNTPMDDALFRLPK